MNRFRRITATAIALCVPAIAIAAVELVEFKDGDVVSAQELNSNFAIVQEAVKKSAAKMTELKTQNTGLMKRVEEIETQSAAANLEEFDDRLRSLEGSSRVAAVTWTQEGELRAESFGAKSIEHEAGTGQYTLTFEDGFSPLCTCSAASPSGMRTCVVQRPGGTGGVLNIRTYDATGTPADSVGYVVCVSWKAHRPAVP